MNAFLVWNELMLWFCGLNSTRVNRDSLWDAQIVLAFDGECSAFFRGMAFSDLKNP